MTQVQLQFHAEAQELLAMADVWMGSHGLHGVVQRFSPDFLVRPVAAGNVASVAVKLGQVRRICLRTLPFEADAPSPHEFLLRNPDCLVIDVGPRTDEGLRESMLGGATDDPVVLKLWRKLVRETKRDTHGGAVAVSAAGDRGPWPRSRHTMGAHALAEAGVPMLAVAGTVRYEFDDLTGSAT